MTDLELRDAITLAGNRFDGHVTVGSCEELLKLLREQLNQQLISGLRNRQGVTKCAGYTGD